MHKSRNLIILITPQPQIVLVLFLFILLKTNLSGHVVRSQKSRSTKVHSEQFRVNFNLPDELTANYFIGNIPSKLPRFPFSMESDHSVSTTLIDNFNLASNLLRLSDSGDLYTLAAIDRDNREQICGPLNCCRLMVCNLTVKVLFVHPQLADVTVHVSLQMHDANDNFPYFTQTIYSLWIPEDNGLISREEQISSRSLYELPSAVDLDSDPNGIVQYRLTGHPIAVSTFQLYSNLTQGQLKLGIRSQVTLDFETLDERIIKLTVQAIDGGQPTHTSEMLLVIHVTDLNDNRPIFVHSTETILVSENNTPDRPIFEVHAIDADSDDNALIRYSFGLGNSHIPPSIMDHFSFHPTTGKLRLRKALDYENYAERHIELRFVAQDAGNPPLSSTMKLIIKVTDINDNPPQLVVQTNRTIVEHTTSEQLALRLMVRDLDEISQHTVHCEGDPNQSVPLRMETSTDNTIISIITTASLDREQYSTLTYSITCVDSAEPRQIVQFILTVVVQDINDNAPIFRSLSNHSPLDQYNITVSEGEPVNKLLLIVTADDADSEELGKVTYSLFDVKLSMDDRSIKHQSQTAAISYKTFFRIDPETGSIFLTKRLDYELTHTLVFGVMAKDNPLGPENLRKSATALITVNIQDINDNPPQLDSPHQIDVVEHSPVGTNLGTIRFSDPDTGSSGKVTVRGLVGNIEMDVKDLALDSNITVYRTEKYFRLTEALQLVTVRSIDREHTPRFFLRILAVDNGDPIQLTTTATVTINVIDINDNSPVVKSPKPNSTVMHTPIRPDDVNQLFLNRYDYGTNRVGKESTSVSKLLDMIQVDQKKADRILHAYVSSPVLVEIHGEDEDIGKNAKISYFLQPKCNGSKYFHLDSNTGYLRSRLRRIDGTDEEGFLTAENIAWVPQTGYYLLCIRLTDHGEPPLFSYSTFGLNVTPALSKATINAMWPADSAEYGTMSSAHADRMGGENWTTNKHPDQNTNRSDISMSNILISLMVAIFALTLICALTASILWAHSKHRGRRNRTSKVVEFSRKDSDHLNRTNDNKQEIRSVNKEEVDDLQITEKHSEPTIVKYNCLSANIMPNPTSKLSPPQSTEGFHETSLGAPISYANYSACSSTALCDLIPVSDSQLRWQPCSFALTSDSLSTSTSTSPNPIINDTYTVYLTTEGGSVQTLQTQNKHRKQQQQQQQSRSTVASSSVTPILDTMESSTTPLLDTTSEGHCPNAVVGTLTNPCPKHGRHYLLHSEASLDKYYTISLPTPVYTINQMLENTNTSTSSKTNLQQSAEYPISLDTIYPNPSNTATILDKTISWVPLPLISESIATPVSAGVIHIDPLVSERLQNSASEEKPV
ncbi:Protocadherin alpha-2 [Fasciola hepatica]|uniref:Protocadherin alpha-2 n=1 Tax=Fasciola hepatica TaxID=6192 RepID=A0A4E0RNH4_FASHE|nr:Protocadherin alpha-2 [Fasciola hepatica]